ncbi:DUF695 domain-containing protein [Aliishimia ponticola]|uniref:DUF695 domain-containing protein n=1 Tax=Aliishimia ponticola TaxID=2499833 RepID=A0A4S4NGQ9_9RHOB|nr:DUF695 domain-containing protein [Aliishimia ponticola]THH38809.1 DUF695 domain-containing protein [Aliishimia ponticola]
MTTSKTAQPQLADTPADIPDQWETFLTMIEDTLCSVVVHVGIEPFLDAMMPATVIQAEIALAHVTANGMPTVAEGKTLMAFDEALQTAIGVPGQHYLGRITANGLRRIYVLIRNDADLPQVERTLVTVGQTHGYEVALMQITDAPLRPYRDLLYPTDQDWQWIADQRQLDALRDAGDMTAETRPVEHWCAFTSPRAAEQFADWARSKGYRVAPVEPGTSHEDGFVVRLTHLATMAPQDIGLHTMRLLDACAGQGGSYEGWQAMVVQSAGQGLAEAQRQGLGAETSPILRLH